MHKTAIAIHAGAGDDSDFIRENRKAHYEGLEAALKAGHQVLQQGGTATDAVQAAVVSLEDNYLFNAGKGSVLNCKGSVEMDVSLMEGKDRKIGAACTLIGVKNPVLLARKLLDTEGVIFVSGSHALEIARKAGLAIEPAKYFITDHQWQDFLRNKEKYKDTVNYRLHGTVGAVALDSAGNTASATSTGGACFSQEGRVGDSCMIGAGVYADNSTCAVSCTGDGEYIIQNAMAHAISSAIEYRQMSVQEACDYIIHEKNKHCKGDLGAVCVDTKGEIGMAFNTVRMHRGWVDSDGNFCVEIYDNPRPK